MVWALECHRPIKLSFYLNMYYFGIQYDLSNVSRKIRNENSQAWQFTLLFPSLWKLKQGITIFKSGKVSEAKIKRYSKTDLKILTLKQYFSHACTSIHILAYVKISHNAQVLNVALQAHLLLGFYLRPYIAHSNMSTKLTSAL